MKTKLSTAAALPISLILTTLVAIPSQAASLSYATKVDFYKEGAGIDEGYRRNTASALGAPQLSAFDSNKNFLALGVGGEAIFSFGTLFHKSVTIWETTWGKKNAQKDYDERVDVYVGNNLDGGWLYLGQILNIADNAYRSNAGASLNIGNNNVYTYLKLVDKSQAGRDRDGFDVNGIGVEAVPEPLTMGGLLLGMSGMVAARRRRVSQS